MTQKVAPTRRLKLASAISVDRYREQFAAGGRVRIDPFLAADSAAALRDHLLAREDWREVINSGDKVFELDRDNQARLAAPDRKRLDEAVNAGARDGFQHRYESIRVPDEAAARRATGSLLDDFAELMSAEPTLALLRTITGLSHIDFADAQGTLYRPGDFLTGHHDEVEGKNRRAAYVFGLTPMWRTEWGGLLLFHEDSGDVTRGLSPKFNALNIFKVPQLHSVSQVASYAGSARLSITGWLRALG